MIMPKLGFPYIDDGRFGTEQPKHRLIEINAYVDDRDGELRISVHQVGEVHTDVQTTEVAFDPHLNIIGVVKKETW